MTNEDQQPWVRTSRKNKDQTMNEECQNERGLVARTSGDAKTRQADKGDVGTRKPRPMKGDQANRMTGKEFQQIRNKNQGQWQPMRGPGTEVNAWATRTENEDQWASNEHWGLGANDWATSIGMARAINEVWILGPSMPMKWGMTTGNPVEWGMMTERWATFSPPFLFYSAYAAFLHPTSLHPLIASTFAIPPFTFPPFSFPPFNAIIVYVLWSTKIVYFDNQIIVY
jgi:hypothetical protein